MSLVCITLIFFFFFRRADHQTVETEKEEVKEDRQQRDTDTYASLKLALQSRLYGILLNWDLFIPAFVLCFSVT